MKTGSIFLVLVMLMLLAFPAWAKTVAYITSENVQDCTLLTSQADKLLCQRLESLGYKVITVWANNVRDNSSTWRDNYFDMIFIGNVSYDMINKSLDREIFCGNISAKPAPVIFSTFNDNLNSSDIMGCVFNYTSYSTGNNTCIGTSEGSFKVNQAGYITYNYSTGDTIQLLLSDVPVYIHDGSGIITTNCQPSNRPSGDYSILNITNTSGKKVVFFGLPHPNMYNSTAWRIFDRTVLYVMDDWYWNFSFSPVPRFNGINVTDKYLIVFTNITRSGFPIPNETVNITISNSTYTYSFLSTVQNATRLNISLPGTGTYKVNFSGDGGSAAFDVSVGQLQLSVASTNITFGGNTIQTPSLTYLPGANLSAKVLVRNGSNPYYVDYVNYTIFNSNGTLVASGQLDGGNDTFYANIELSEWGPEVYIAFFAKNTTTSQFGAYLNRLSRSSPENLTTLSVSPSSARPGDTVTISIISPSNITANITSIKDSSGFTWISNVPMTCDGNNCSFAFSTGANYTNGTYSVIASIVSGNSTFTKNITFDVLAWNIFASTSKLRYKSGDTFSITVKTQDVYNSSLRIAIKLTMSPNVVSLPDFTLTGDSNITITRPVNESWTQGNYTITISANDSFSRTWTGTLMFTVSPIGNVTVDPEEWNLAVASSGLYTQAFKITNLLNDTLSVSSFSASNWITLNTSNISSDGIPANSSAIFTAKANITDEGSYSGNITIITSYDVFIIPVNITYSKEITITGLSIEPSSVTIITVPDRQEKVTVKLTNGGETTASNFTYTSSLKNLTLKLPSSLSPGSSANIELTYDSSGETVELYDSKSGSVKIDSSLGSVNLGVVVRILGDVEKIKAAKLAVLADLETNASKLQNKSKVAEIKQEIEKLKSSLDNLSDLYSAGNYSEVWDSLDNFSKTVDSIKSEIAGAAAAEAENAKKTADLIWLAAIIIIIVIISIVIFKFRKKIFARFIKPKPQERPQERQPQREEPRREEKKEEEIFKEPGEYRIEYY